MKIKAIHWDKGHRNNTIALAVMLGVLGYALELEWAMIAILVMSASMVYGILMPQLMAEKKLKREKQRQLSAISQWIQVCTMHLNTGVPVPQAVRVSSAEFVDCDIFLKLVSDLNAGSSSLSAFTRFSEAAGHLIVSRYISRLLLYEASGNPFLIQMMEEDSSELWEKQLDGSMQIIEKSMTSQALPSLLIFATVMIQLMYPILKGGAF